MELTTIWFILIAVLWTGYFVLEGFDFGVGMLGPLLGRKRRDPVTAEKRKRVLLNTIGPVWDANEVWLLTAVGATFAAFPAWYGTMLSGFYLPLLLILVALIVRVLGFDYRNKTDDPIWRKRWDRAILFGSYVPAFTWGMLFTNLVHGVPLNADEHITANPFSLLNPLGVLGGLVTVFVFAVHGGNFLTLKTDGPIRASARRVTLSLTPLAVILTVIWLIALNVKADDGMGWLLSGLAVLALAAGWPLAFAGREGLAFTATFIAIGLTVAALFVMLFPNVLVSSTDPANSITAVDAASTHSTLVILTWVAGFFTPIVIAYQSYTYWVFRKRITTDHIPPAHDEREYAPVDDPAGDRAAHRADDASV